jgi:hypothetical protein
MSAATFNDANDAFFSDFMKCISTEQDYEQVEDASLCLITNEPLKEYAVRLNCGHSFNNEPLTFAMYQYKLDQKNNNGLLDCNTYCPYCREKTEGLLPCTPKSDKITGVNMPHKHSFGTNACKHMISSKKDCGRKCYYDKCHIHLGMHDTIMCKGITKAGTPCKNKASSSVVNYCKLHNK